MNIGFIGDIHGCACHTLSILLTWQAMRKKPFDLVVQVGDLGIIPHPESGEVPFVNGDWLSTYQREGGVKLLADTIGKIGG